MGKADLYATNITTLVLRRALKLKHNRVASGCLAFVIAQLAHTFRTPAMGFSGQVNWFLKGCHEP